jgi:hypothetical protein
MKSYFVVCRGAFDGIGTYATREEAEKAANIRNILQNCKTWSVREIFYKDKKEDK